MRKIAFVILILVLNFSLLLAQSTKVSGKITSANTKETVSDVRIQLVGSKIIVKSNFDGLFELEIPKGTVASLAFSKGGFDNLVEKIGANEKDEINLEIELREKEFNLNDVVVYGASKRLQKVTESPAAITRLDKEEIAKASRSNQLGFALNGTPGVDVLLNGSTDFIINTRGFNNGLNRRVLVLQDGRDMAMPLLGAQEWNSSALPLDEYSNIEFIRGPASALYGANSFNGVMALTSYAPKEVIGTKASITAGDYETFRGDIRNAGYITDKLSYKVTFGRSSSLNISRSRTDSSMLEYDGARLERRPIYDNERNTFSKYGTLRFDYDFDESQRIVLEGGYSDSGGEVFVQPLGRVLVSNTQRPYGRLAYNSEKINFNASYMRRDNRDSMWLLFANRGPNMPLGSPIWTEDDDMMFDLQYNENLTESGETNIVVGVSQQFQSIDTKGTTLRLPVDANFTGIYGQFETKFTDFLKLVISGRFDHTNIHADQFSPRLALVIDAAQNHTFRLSAGRSFQRPNYSELFRYTADRGFNPLTNANLAGINALITDSLRTWSGNQNINEVDLGLAGVPGLAVGNNNLKVEQNIGFELGYQGVVNNSIFFTADFYYNQINDFITNFGPGFNTGTERWTANLEGELAQYDDRVTDLVRNKLIGDDRVRLSNYENQTALIQSVGNFGQVNQYGIDLGVNWYLNNSFLLSANYSYYDFDLVRNENDPVISPNTAPHKANISLQYTEQDKFDLKATVQYMDTYLWIAGASVGQVPSYVILNLNGGFKVAENVDLGFNIFNALDGKVLHLFGGVFMPRMSTVKLTVQI